MKPAVVARTARYSGRKRPAWRISHTGGGQTASPFNTRRIFFVVGRVVVTLCTLIND
jgi:hypothetical protein